MRRIYIDRTIIIESRIESHTGAYASAFHLYFFIYLSGDGMPSQLGNRTIRYRINPTFINGVCQTIYIDSSCRSFQIRIITVEQLVPKSFSTLQRRHSTHMSTEIIHHLRTLGIIFRQYIQQFTSCQQRPSIGTCPAKSRMIRTAFHPSVSVQSLFGDKHTVCKLQELLHGFCQIFILRFLIITTHLRYHRNAHKHIIQPKSIPLRTITGKRSVCQTIFFVDDKIKVILN